MFPNVIKEFLLTNDLYDHQWHGERCPHCDAPFKNLLAVTTHLRFCEYRYKPEDQQNFTGTCAEKKSYTIPTEPKEKEEKQ